MDWFKLWVLDKQNIMETMRRNLVADLKAGYDPLGKTATQQLENMKAYRENYEKELMSLADMSEEKAKRWCYLDLIRRGAITP